MIFPFFDKPPSALFKSSEFSKDKEEAMKTHIYTVGNLRPLFFGLRPFFRSEDLYAFFRSTAHPFFRSRYVTMPTANKMADHRKIQVNYTRDFRYFFLIKVLSLIIYIALVKTINKGNLPAKFVLS